MFCAVWDYLNSEQNIANYEQKDKQYLLTNIPESNKTETKIPANPGLA